MSWVHKTLLALIGLSCLSCDPTIATDFRITGKTPAFSAFLTTFWFLVMKPRMVDKTRAGMSREALLGETGQVISVPEGDRRGVVRFTKPLLGSDEWSFICDETVQLGDRVQIRDVSGNTLIVAPKITR